MSPEEYQRKCQELNDDIDGAIWGVLIASCFIGVLALVAVFVDKLS